jgi:hypothetical protein
MLFFVKNLIKKGGIVMEHSNRFNSYKNSEGRTGKNQIVEFTHPIDVNAEQVKDFLQTNIRTINIPTTKQVNVGHGAYSQYSRYEITQHDYVGGMMGYIELLEIKNPPDNRCGIIINEYMDNFTEWETLENARAAFKKYWAWRSTNFYKLLGFKRQVVCEALTPWFYAIGDEELIGDYVLPKNLQDDPVYRLGKKFVVFDNDLPVIKTCIGTCLRREERSYYPHEEYEYRTVYWDDGSVWKEELTSGKALPRPLEQGEMWITEAIQQFKQLLAGKRTEFNINFTNNNKFVGKLVTNKKMFLCAEGDYLLVVKLKVEKNPLEGWVTDFNPTQEAPNVIQYVTQRFAQNEKEVEWIKVKQRKVKKGGKKWSGVFLYSSP